MYIKCVCVSIYVNNRCIYIWYTCVQAQAYIYAYASINETNWRVAEESLGGEDTGKTAVWHQLLLLHVRTKPLALPRKYSAIDCVNEFLREQSGISSEAGSETPGICGIKHVSNGCENRPMSNSSNASSDSFLDCYSLNWVVRVPWFPSLQCFGLGWFRLKK